MVLVFSVARRGMSPIAWFFVVYVGAYLPIAAWRSGRHVAGGATLPARPRLYASAAFLQGVLLFLAWFAARDEWILLFPALELGVGDVLVGIGWVAIKYARFWWMYRLADAPSRRRMLGHLAPRTFGEIAGYFGLVALAAVAEEAAYRGVLFQLAERATGSFLVAGLASAALFGAAHLTQGRRPAVTAGILGFGNQIVVWLTGSLAVAIGAHFIYDIIVGIVVGRHMNRARTGTATGT